jgi:NADPH:quinone reductase-like Zn-dependent oxidoreductase
MKGVEQLIQGDPTSLVVSNDLPIPPTKDTDVVIKVACAGVNRIDLIQSNGHYKVPDDVSEVLGLEVSGSIIVVGKDCTRGFKEGDTVCALLSGGGYAEFAAVDERFVLPGIPSLTMSEMGSIPEAFLTSYQLAIIIAKAESGQSALVHAGASGIGQVLTRMLVKKGVNVIATTRSRSKMQVCLDSGASDVVMPVSTSNSGRDLIALGHSATTAKEGDGDGDDQPKKKRFFAARAVDANGGIVGEHFDMVFCPVGNDYFEENMACLKTDGKLILYGLLGGATGMIDGALMNKILFNRISIIPSTLRSRSAEYKDALIQSFLNDQECGYPTLQSGAIKPLHVEFSYSLEDVMTAHSIMAKNRNVGKIMLMVNEQTKSLEYFAREMQQLERTWISPQKEPNGGGGEEEKRGNK